MDAQTRFSMMEMNLIKDPSFTYQGNQTGITIFIWPNLKNHSGVFQRVTDPCPRVKINKPFSKK